MTEPQIDWTKTHQLIHSWLRERHEVLVMYNDLCHERPFLDETKTNKLLSAFCQLLIDYVSCGQFAVFEVIATASSCNPNPRKTLSTKLIQELLTTTFECTVFNDKYETNTDLNELETSLSRLGEVLAQRLELEDELLRIYMEAADYLQNQKALAG